LTRKLKKTVVIYKRIGKLLLKNEMRIERQLNKTSDLTKYWLFSKDCEDYKYCIAEVENNMIVLSLKFLINKDSACESKVNNK